MSEFKFTLGTYRRNSAEGVPPTIRVGETADVLRETVITKQDGVQAACYIIRYPDRFETLIEKSSIEPGEFTPK